MSQVDQKRAFNKLKHDLEPWRNIIVNIQSLLIWEKNFYPAVLAAAISIFFIILWAIDLSVVTTLSLCGLTAVVGDYIYPSIAKYFFNPDNWSGTQEAKFERVCTQLCAIKTYLGGWYEYLFTNKERKSTVFVIVMAVLLLAMAWVGAVMNNLLLMYLVTIVVVMFPGIRENNVFDAVKQKFGGVVTSKIQQIRDKTQKSE